MPILKSYSAYFIRPFPGTQGFSAYRFPGMLVHIPLFLIFLFLGLYLGRDIAIYAHYNPLITVAVILFIIFSPALITKVLQPLRTSLDETFPFFALILDLGTLAAYIFYVRSWVKKAA